METDMHCEQVLTQLDDYLDGQLDADQAGAMSSHLSGCENCAAHLAHENEFRSLLKQYPADEPAAGFAARAFRKSRKQASFIQPGTFKGFVAGAMAAALVAWLVAGVFIRSTMDQSTGPHVVLAMNKVTMVHLVFNASKDIPNAKIALQFPPNLELAHRPGVRNIAWRSHLVKGRNMLTLPIVALSATSGEFSAKVNFGDKVKWFVIKQDVQTAGQHPATSTGQVRSSATLV